jgi:hypothetical protein
LSELRAENPELTRRLAIDPEPSDMETKESKDKRIKLVDVQGRERWVTTEEMKEQKSVNIIPYGLTTVQLGNQIADYVRNEPVESLFASRGLRRLFLRFWIEKHPTVVRKSISNPSVRLKRREAEEIAANALERDKKAFLESVSEKLTRWATDRNMMRVTRAHVRLFLMDNQINLDHSTERLLYQQVKLKYRYLPPWKREKTP